MEKRRGCLRRNQQRQQICQEKKEFMKKGAPLQPIKVKDSDHENVPQEIKSGLQVLNMHAVLYSLIATGKSVF